MQGGVTVDSVEQYNKIILLVINVTMRKVTKITQVIYEKEFIIRKYTRRKIAKFVEVKGQNNATKQAGYLK